MTQAETRLSTPPTNTPTSRRRFLSTAATLAAGSAALLGLAIPPALATDDPIFAAIEAHKAAFARVIAAIDVEQAVEAAIPAGMRLQTYKTDERWLESGKAVSGAWDAEGDAAIELVNVHPTTMAGVMALLHYAIAADRDGEMWPPTLAADDGETVGSWHYLLIRNLTEILPSLLQSMGGQS